MPIFLFGLDAAAREVLSGPVEAVVERVIDGDTLAVRARVWLGQEIAVLVRLRGIDAPEMRGDCAGERALAGLAARYLLAVTAAGTVALSDITGDKYHGRVVARVVSAEGRDLSGALLKARLARPYEGGPRGRWCDSADE